MKEQDEARCRRESQARARKTDKRHDFRESPAEARKACKTIVFAHTKRSLEKLVFFLPCPAQKKANETFFIETHREILWFARRQAEARKICKIRAFRESRTEARKDNKQHAFRTT